MAEWKVEQRGSIELWTILGVGRSNTLNRALVGELEERAKALVRSGAPRAVVLTGEGDRAFCAGADLKERQEMSLADVRAFLRQLNQTLQLLEASDTVFVAALNGAALGGGLELALACDLRVAAPAAELGTPEVKLGIIPGAGGTQRLSRLLGVGRAKDLILTGRKLNAGEAFALGLVNRLAPEGRLLDLAVELAEQVARNAPIAIAAAKHAVDRGWGLNLADAIRVEGEEYEKTLVSEDRNEGLRAFKGKRPADFQGR